MVTRAQSASSKTLGGIAIFFFVCGGGEDQGNLVEEKRNDATVTYGTKSGPASTYSYSYSYPYSYSYQECSGQLAPCRHGDGIDTARRKNGGRFMTRVRVFLSEVFAVEKLAAPRLQGVVERTETRNHALGRKKHGRGRRLGRRQWRRSLARSAAAAGSRRVLR